MTPDKFIIKINLETEDMRTCNDVIDALEFVICDIRDTDFKSPWADEGSIYDRTGINVGHWKIKRNNP